MVRVLNISEARNYLRLTEGEVQRMIKEDGLPTVVLPGARKPRPKIPLLPFYNWLKKQTRGTFMTYDEFKEDIKLHLISK